jgi:transposase
MAGTQDLHGEGAAMPRALPTLLPRDLERRLLRKGVGALTAGRHRCADCGRTPLFGEHVHHYGARVVCALCSGRRVQDPDRVERVHHCEHGHAVKVRAA